LAEWSAPLLSIQEVLDSNLHQEAGYPEVFLHPWNEISGYTSDKTKVVSIIMHHPLIIQPFNPIEPEFLKVLLIKNT
jgi:hypothetical protein